MVILHFSPFIFSRAPPFGASEMIIMAPITFLNMQICGLGWKVYGVPWWGDLRSTQRKTRAHCRGLMWIASIPLTYGEVVPCSVYVLEMKWSKVLDETTATTCEIINYNCATSQKLNDNFIYDLVFLILFIGITTYHRFAGRCDILLFLYPLL